MTMCPAHASMSLKLTHIPISALFVRLIDFSHRIFILHGLNGGVTKTWQHPETTCIWFRDLLPAYIKSRAQQNNARIWTYGYNASTTFNTQDVYGHALTLLNRVETVRRGHEVRRYTTISVVSSLSAISRTAKSSGYATRWEELS